MVSGRCNAHISTKPHVTVLEDSHSGGGDGHGKIDTSLLRNYPLIIFSGHMQIYSNSSVSTSNIIKETNDGKINIKEEVLRIYFTSPI